MPEMVVVKGVLSSVSGELTERIYVRQYVENATLDRPPWKLEPGIYPPW